MVMEMSCQQPFDIFASRIYECFGQLQKSCDCFSWEFSHGRFLVELEKNMIGLCRIFFGLSSQVEWTFEDDGWGFD
jgi:hypothetical protein